MMSNTTERQFDWWKKGARQKDSQGRPSLTRWCHTVTGRMQMQKVMRKWCTKCATQHIKHKY